MQKKSKFVQIIPFVQVGTRSEAAAGSRKVVMFPLMMVVAEKEEEGGRGGKSKREATEDVRKGQVDIPFC